MNRMLRAIIGACLVLIIVFSAISICHDIGSSWKIDVTGEKLYTLSDGTKSILSKLNQPVTAKLFYASTAALKGPDQIQYYNNYYEYVKSLLEEYVSVSNDMVKLEVIDPRPFSDDEEHAIGFGLRQYRVSEEESFFFGLVVQTQFGVEKVIPFFSPDRQSFIEYDISYLIDSAITRQKNRIGIMSSLPVIGDSEYMAQMLAAQKQQPRMPWTFVEHLKKKYEVTEIPTDVNDINDIDILLVVHPKNLPQQTLFAIDQYILKGGRTIICVDPHCFSDPSRNVNQGLMLGSESTQASDLNVLLRTWGIEMPRSEFAGDLKLAESRAVSQNTRVQKILGLLNLTRDCFNRNNVITAQLNEVRVLFSGVLNLVADPNKPEDKEFPIERTPLLMTTDKGNSFAVTNSYELMLLDPSIFLQRFIEGTKPVTMGYLLSGRFKSSFPDGIEIETAADGQESSSDSEDPNQPKTAKKQIKGLMQSEKDCAVAVFADVDFISDMLAYQNFLGLSKAVVGDNSALLFNTIDDLSGSSDLISIRSRGNVKRPFIVVDEIERKAEAETAAKLASIDAEIAGFNAKRQSISPAAGQDQELVISKEILKDIRDLEEKIYQKQKERRLINMEKSEKIDRLGRKLQRANTIAAPAVVLFIAIVLWLWRSMRRRHYISHSSDA
ncbi:MAG: GldG family protein [Sedimentisphaerales bacterium]|nr:GldG family protein [Sedimentisphaerales bacterium]